MYNNKANCLSAQLSVPNHPIPGQVSDSISDEFTDLLSALAPFGEWEDCLFMSLHCYIDESESKSADSPAVSVAAYLAQGKHWQRFAKDWNKQIDRAHKRVEVFHATDYAGRRKSKHGSFFGWTQSERKAWFSGLVNVIKAHKLKEFATVVRRSTFSQVMTGRRGSAQRSLLVITAEIVMIEACAWALAKGFQYAPSFFVESGSEYYAEIKEAHTLIKNDERMAKQFSRSAFPEVPKSRAYPQTQPADMLAYYSSLWLSRLDGYDPGNRNSTVAEYQREYMQRNNPTVPDELMELLPGPRHNVMFHTPDTLDAYLKKLKGDPRRHRKVG